MIINHNMGAMNANRNMGINATNAGKSMEKLSSGLRINKAGDDAAGLAISEKMRGQIRGLDQASANAQDGISLLQTAEGGLSESHSILQRMRELAVQGANDTMQTNDRTAIGTEMTQLNEELDRIGNTTQFNGKVLLDGNFGVKYDATSTVKEGTAKVTDITVSGARASATITLVNTANKVTATDELGNVQVVAAAGANYTGTLNFDKLGVSVTVANQDMSGTAWVGGTVKTGATADQQLQIGANNGQVLGISVSDMRSTALGVNGVSVSSNTTANAAIVSIDTAIGTVSTQRSKLGAWQNRLEHTIANLGTSSENLTSAESRIRDVNMAKEMSTFSKNNILSQAAQAMLAQANQQPQQVLQLLR
jgi:flagellin